MRWIPRKDKFNWIELKFIIHSIFFLHSKHTECISSNKVKSKKYSSCLFENVGSTYIRTVVIDVGQWPFCSNFQCWASSSSLSSSSNFFLSNKKKWTFGQTQLCSHPPKTLFPPLLSTIREGERERGKKDIINQTVCTISILSLSLRSSESMFFQSIPFYLFLPLLFFFFSPCFFVIQFHSPPFYYRSTFFFLFLLLFRLQYSTKTDKHDIWKESEWVSEKNYSLKID